MDHFVKSFINMGTYISFAIAAGENFAADSLGWKPQKGTSIF
jgi:hypothetical protein